MKNSLTVSIAIFALIAAFSVFAAEDITKSKNIEAEIAKLRADKERAEVEKNRKKTDVLRMISADEFSKLEKVEADAIKQLSIDELAKLKNDKAEALKQRAAEELARLTQEKADAIRKRMGEGDPVAGATKSQFCHGCHGERGLSAHPLIPNLAGQYGKYITKEVRNYQAGTRTHQIMTMMATTISDDDLDDISAYFSSLPMMTGSQSAVNAIGKNLYLKGDRARGIFACVGCHGEHGKGKHPSTHMFPVLGGQRKEYLIVQLIHWRASERTNSASGIMNLIAKLLTDEEIEALADYLSGL